MAKEIDENILAKFPDYDGKPGHYVGSKEYWKGIFAWEENRDPELHTAFSKLHKEIVDKIIQFCKERHLDNIDEVFFKADGLMASYECGKWTPFTDSSMSFIKCAKDEKTGWMLPDREHPFLYEI